ncbi:MAG TPA: ImmA/IrrE family metallo-endopeptidase [Solirubrobacteraceae bacterium]|nr:ImmA/IrrE family metallo-endopeptidase [Solirubrobacteraceae bacterium]HUA74347.1 ImmA/IrrE family metallo-endopeptidase [Solirubrobacteraceae bacterium]
MTPTVATLTKTDSAAGLLARLRGLVPRRGLSPAEARQVAERQAAILLAAAGVNAPAVPDSVVSDQPFVTITRRPGFPTSGMATQTDSGWVIVLRAEEAKVRQRFSMIHEFKHVLDDPFIEWLYPTKNGLGPEDRAERICDYFAACVLMPKMWVKRDWAGDGIQDIARLARRYRVSQVAMAVRLSELRLLPPTPRCAGTSRTGDA